MRLLAAPITLSLLLTVALAQENAQAECLSRPALGCYLIPTLSYTLEGDQSQVRGGMSLSPYFLNDQCFTRVAGNVTGLGDATPHGIHVHELGDIRAPDGTSTGGHYNPFGNSHALPGEGSRQNHHVGDLGNLFPDDQGFASFDVIYEDPISTWALVGRSIVIHAAEDNGQEAQPTGGAGSRLAVCVLGRLTS